MQHQDLSDKSANCFRLIRAWSVHETDTPQPARSRWLKTSLSKRILYGKERHFVIQLPLSSRIDSSGSQLLYSLLRCSTPIRSTLSYSTLSYSTELLYILRFLGEQKFVYRNCSTKLLQIILILWQYLILWSQLFISNQTYQSIFVYFTCLMQEMNVGFPTTWTRTPCLKAKPGKCGHGSDSKNHNLTYVLIFAYVWRCVYHFPEEHACQGTGELSSHELCLSGYG